MRGIEPLTSSLPRKRSTPELHRPCSKTRPVLQTVPGKFLHLDCLHLKKASGKRDSNSRPQPWKGCALPTELFPPVIILKRTHKKNPDPEPFLFCGERRNRTSEGVRQQIYSLPQLATLVSPLILKPEKQPANLR
jgi:hypothetical protein